MPDFLGRLAARSLGMVPVVQPVVPTIFEPGSVGERLDPARDTGHGSFERVEVRPDPSAEPATAVMNAAGSGENSLPETRPQSSPVASTTVSSYGLVGTSEVVARGIASQTKLPAAGNERTTAIADDQSESVAVTADAFSVVPENQRPASPGERLAMPETFVRAARERIRPVPFSSFSLDSGAGDRASATTSQTSAPVVRVTIGRVDVRAEFPAPVSRPRTTPAQPAALSLEEYARQRREGKR